MSTKELVVEVSDGVARLTICRPERRNALSPSVLKEMIEVMSVLEWNPDVRVICITGEGDKAFCSGADLMSSLEGKTDPAESSLFFAKMLQAMSKCSKPLVGRLNGHAMGGGFGLALAMDVVIARENIFLGTPEVKVGLFPFMIAPLILRNMARKQAMELILSGGKLTAQEALQAGCINQVVADDDLDAAVDSCLKRLVEAAPLAQQRGKQALREIEALSFDDAVERLSEHLAFLMQTEDAKEGISSFLKKKKPVWKGQ